MTAILLDDPDHRAFLADDARRSLDLFDASPRAAGGFHGLGVTGRPLPGGLQELHSTTRLVHSYALAQLAGRSDRAGIIDQGMEFLWNGHRDRDHGGYLWSVDGKGALEGTKLAYGHVFVLLAASSAKMVGHPDADRLLSDITEVLDRHFWDTKTGLFRDEFTRDWQVFSTYRGMNANMHGVEALLAAHEATGEGEFLSRAGGILRFFIGGQAAGNGWRIPEHYDADWRPDHGYSGNPMFRPAGTTPATASRWRACCCNGGIWRDGPKATASRRRPHWCGRGWQTPGTTILAGFPIRLGATVGSTTPRDTGGP